MENFIFSFQAVVFILLMIGILLMIFSDKEKNKYRKINFKNKKKYLCVYYLYGNKDLKSNIGVLSDNGDSYLLETEDKVTVHTFSFLKNEVVKVEVKVKSGIGMESQVVCHEFNASKDLYIDNFEVEEGRNMKIKKIYAINLTLSNGMKLCFESSKDPKYFFMVEEN